jgi:formylglycine-generating enzyme required for sulfatase activity
MFHLFVIPLLALAQPSTITTPTGLNLVLIPAGEFLMGGVEPAESLAQTYSRYHRPATYFADEYPQHRVRISRPFYMGQTEVTIAQFRQFTTETGYRTEAEIDGKGGWGYNAETRKCEGRRTRFTWRDPGFPQSDNHPVVNVTWNDAQAFLQWLGKRDGHTYRLPTEAEWEYANRAGSTTRYNTGSDPLSLQPAANTLDDTGITEFPHVGEELIASGAKIIFTAPVAQYRPNAWGLYDMHGNVWEWCSDWYGEKYYRKSPAADPQGPRKGNVKVRRGGGWNSFPLWSRSSFRNWNTPNSRCLNLGFRVVRDN